MLRDAAKLTTCNKILQGFGGPKQAQDHWPTLACFAHPMALMGWARVPTYVFAQVEVGDLDLPTLVGFKEPSNYLMLK